MTTNGNKILLETAGCCGGLERMTVLYGKILQEAGFYVVLVIYLSDSNKSEYALKPFVPSDWQIEFICGKLRYFGWSLLKAIRKNSPDVVFASSMIPAHFLSLFKALHLIKASVIVRENTSPIRKSKAQCVLSHLLYPFASVIIAQTKEMKEEMVDCYHLKEDNIVVINNPLDNKLIDEKSREIFSYDHKYINYLAVGRVAKPKDYFTLLKAFEIVHKANHFTRLYIVGGFEDLSIKKKLDSMVSNSEFCDFVFFEGFQSNPYKYIKGCDVFCLSSSIEGLPNVLQEALYLGKPVVSTICVPFVSQIIIEGQNGYTCGIKDPVRLAQCMMKGVDLIGHQISYSSETEQKIIKVFGSNNSATLSTHL